MDERLKFVARRLDGESISELCRQFGISRKTGYKIFDRYQQCGVQGLTDRSRRPYRYAHQLPCEPGGSVLPLFDESDSFMQDLPNHAAEPMGDGPERGLIAQPT